MFKTVSASSGAAWRRPGTNGRPLGAAHFRPADARHGRRRWLTGGKKVPVVYDFVGQDAFLKSLDYPAPLGVAALFGKSSGAVDPLNLGLLAAKAGSLSRVRHSTATAHSRSADA